MVRVLRPPDWSRRLSALALASALRTCVVGGRVSVGGEITVGGRVNVVGGATPGGTTVGTVVGRTFLVHFSQTSFVTHVLFAQEGSPLYSNSGQNKTSSPCSSASFLSCSPALSADFPKQIKYRM